MAKITVVDDSRDVCRMVDFLLRNQGHEVTCILDPHIAITHLIENLPDLAILDLTMPGMDGLELLRQIKQMPYLQALKVVMYSAVDTPSCILEAVQLGALDYLRKDLPWENVYTRIAKHLPVPPRSDDSWVGGEGIVDI